MKKIRAAAAALALMTGLSACTSSSFGVVIEDNHNAVISGENADKEAKAETASLNVKDGQKISVDAEITSGEVVVRLYTMPETTDEENVPSHENEKAALEFTLNKSGESEYPIAAGEYSLEAEVVQEFSGTIEIDVD